MSQKANQVVSLLEELRRMHISGENQQTGPSTASGRSLEQRGDAMAVDSTPAAGGDDRRPPKRPWEDMSSGTPNEGNAPGDGHAEVSTRESLSTFLQAYWNVGIVKAGQSYCTLVYC
jgi:hypothetical protein